ncbi:MAG: permease-like cell division protein FtsX [Clostridia bacterium]|nr:permease-like cell division protein FtsX [Clostridia bacterium]
MKYNILSYLIGEGIASIFKNKKSSIASLGTMCATMFVFGVFFALTQNINSFVGKIESEQAIRVNIEKDATDEQIATLKEEISNIEGVNEITYKSEEDALEYMKEKFGDKAYYLEPYEERNIFSAAYVVTLTDLNLNKSVQEQILKLDAVKSITGDSPTVDKLISVAKGIRIVSLVLLVLLVSISIFIISNTIKLAVHARRKEISIMKYVGATNGFIRFPFMVEGIVIGLAAGAITILLVGLAYNGIASNLTDTTSLVLGMKLVSFSEMFKLIVLVYLILGIGIGMIGSSISMRKYLEV